LERPITNGISGPNGSDDPIVVVGMALRLPGGINSSESFWDLLVEKRDARGPVPSDRYNGDAFNDPLSRPGTASVYAGYFLDNDLQNFDSSSVSMSIAEIVYLDPMQRQLLEIVRECLESSGETSWRGKSIGCFVGSFGEDWQDLRTKDTQDFGSHRMTGFSDFAPSNRISYEYNFTGPRYVKVILIGHELKK
jgi:acyl transferase domain-containing protein